MIEIDVEEAQANLKDYLAKVKLGEKVVVRAGPIEKFELIQIASDCSLPPLKRRVGAGVGQMTIHPSFYEPLPDEILAYFEGRSTDRKDAQS